MSGWMVVWCVGEKERRRCPDAYWSRGVRGRDVWMHASVAGKRRRCQNACWCGREKEEMSGCMLVWQERGGRRLCGRGSGGQQYLGETSGLGFYKLLSDKTPC